MKVIISEPLFLCSLFICSIIVLCVTIACTSSIKQNNYQQILYRQYRAQILRRAHEIERELEEDLAVLERVELESRRDEHDQTARFSLILKIK